MGTALMASKRDKKDNAGMDIAKAIIDKYDPKNAEDMQAAIHGKRTFLYLFNEKKICYIQCI